MQNRLEYIGGQKLLGVGVEELEKVLFKELIVIFNLVEVLHIGIVSRTYRFGPFSSIYLILLLSQSLPFSYSPIIRL